MTRRHALRFDDARPVRSGAVGVRLAIGRKRLRLIGRVGSDALHDPIDQSGGSGDGRGRHHSAQALGFGQCGARLFGTAQQQFGLMPRLFRPGRQIFTESIEQILKTRDIHHPRPILGGIDATASGHDGVNLASGH